MGNKPRGDRELTPFAEALQEWLYHGHRIPWSRATLARALDIPHSTVTGWFVRGNMPEADAFHALLRVTEWTPEKLMRLTGYTEMPAKIQNVWQFIREKLKTAEGLDASTKVRAQQYLDEWQAEYNNLPVRPPRRRTRATEGAAASAAERPSAPEAQPDEAPTKRPSENHAATVRTRARATHAPVHAK